MKISLYHLHGSRSKRVRWALEELGLNYELINIDLFKGEADTPEYRAIHPLGQLPALKVDDDVMIESGAMVHWLADAHPEAGLAPALDSDLRRKYDQWMYFAATTLEGPAWERVLHGKILPDEHAVKAIIPFAEARLKEILPVIEQALDDADYLLGKTFSAADIMMGYILMWLPDMITPELKSYLERLTRRPAYQRADAAN